MFQTYQLYFPRWVRGPIAFVCLFLSYTEGMDAISVAIQAGLLCRVPQVIFHVMNYASLPTDCFLELLGHHIHHRPLPLFGIGLGSEMRLKIYSGTDIDLVHVFSLRLFQCSIIFL